MELKYIAKKEDIGLTINQILQSKLKISNRLRQQIINEKLITCNELLCDTRKNLKLGDFINIDFNYWEDNSNIVPTPMDLDILYEDEWILIVNKPSGIPVHPSMQHYENSLSNGIKFYFDTIGLHKKIRPVNRLDIGTSGIVVFAKCAYSHEYLSLQMQNNTFSKTYLAIVHGKLDENTGTIDLPIARKNNSIIERCIDFETGKPSITKYEVLDYSIDSNCSIVKCNLITGRTHQIRVHFSHIGHPLIGDSLYGNFDFKRLMLHCSAIKFTPINTNNFLIIKSPPKDFYI